MARIGNFPGANPHGAVWVERPSRREMEFFRKTHPKLLVLSAPTIRRLGQTCLSLGSYPSYEAPIKNDTSLPPSAMIKAVPGKVIQFSHNGEFPVTFFLRNAGNLIPKYVLEMFFFRPGFERLNKGRTLVVCTDPEKMGKGGELDFSRYRFGLTYVGGDMFLVESYDGSNLHVYANMMREPEIPDKDLEEVTYENFRALQGIILSQRWEKSAFGLGMLDIYAPDLSPEARIFPVNMSLNGKIFGYGVNMKEDVPDKEYFEVSLIADKYHRRVLYHETVKDEGRPINPMETNAPIPLSFRKSLLGALITFDAFWAAKLN